MKQRVILLNGPSSSGKSTLSKTLQALIREKLSLMYDVVSIDDFMKTDSMEPIYEDDVYDISGELCEQVLKRMKNCCGVIIDHVITSERIFNQLKETVEGYSFSMIQVTCSPELLRKREKERGDRCPGSAETSAEYLFPKEGYDLVVDTGLKSPTENSMEILNTLLYSHDIELIKLTEENLQQCFELKVASDQTRYIASNSDSWNAARENENVARPFAIYCDGEMAGFTMFAFDEDYEDPDDRYWLWRFMIDEKLQGKGCGTAALKVIIQYFKDHGANNIRLSTKDTNTKALSLYRKAGFRDTGEMNDEEIVLQLDL